MSKSLKPMSERDANQTLQIAYTEDLAGFEVNTQWVTGRVGRLITDVISTTTVANDTITSTYTEGALTICTLVTIYTDGTRTVRKSIQRTT